MDRPAIRTARRFSSLLLFAGAMTLLPAGPVHAADSVCVYRSRSYSEGAFICVQKSLMQACMSDGSRLVWKIVADRDLGDRCVSPVPLAGPRKRWVRHARTVRHAAPPPEPASAKCFVFNGKRYCE